MEKRSQEETIGGGMKTLTLTKPFNAETIKGGTIRTCGKAFIVPPGAGVKGA